MTAPEEPTREQLAASIGCKPEQIKRTAHRPIDGQWISFVDEGDPRHLSVYQTVWPQP